MFINHFTNSKQEKLNKGEPTEGVFFTPNGYKGRRLKDTNLTNVNAVFADWDFKPAEGGVTGSGKPDYKQFRLDLDGLPEPTYVVESGNGWHLYWCLEETIPVDDTNRADLIKKVEGIHRHIHVNYGSDNGAMDTLRLMRLPGYEHKKQPEHPFMVSVVEDNSDTTYTLDELLELIPPVYHEEVVAETGVLTENADKMIKKMLKHEKIAKLYDADIEDYKGLSEADSALCCHLAFWLQKDREAMRTAWLASPLGSREKTQKRVDYQDRTIDKAIALTTEVYKAPAPKLEAQEDELYERKAYREHLAQGDWDNKNWLKELKRLQENYVQVFHQYFASKYPNLLYEVGETKVYWNYNNAVGIYEELAVSTVNSMVARLLEEEDMVNRATDTFVKTCLLRFRGRYMKRGKTYNDFDSHLDWFHASNGWVNVDTREFEPHTEQRLSRRVSAVEYNPEAVCPVYDKFLNEDLHIADDVIRVIDQFSGLLLTPDIKYEKMLTLIGRPASGKSTLLNIWKHVLGDMATQKKLTEVSGDSARFIGASLSNKTLCWFDEVDVKRSEMGNSLGTMITGDTINVERKGINHISTVNNSLKCVLTANSLPLSSEHGMYRRLILVYLERSFLDEGVINTNMRYELESESSGILNRMLTGLADLRKYKGFTVIAGHEDLIEEYKNASDPLAGFLSTYFEPVTDSEIKANVLFDAYKEFRSGDGFVRSLTPQKFGLMMKSQSSTAFSKIKSKRYTEGSRWVGLQLKNEYKFDVSGRIEVSSF